MVLNQSNAKPYYKEQGKLYEGQKRYELSNHLGNVLAVINDRKTMTTRGLFYTYDATVISAQDYFPFGLEMGSERQVSNTEDGYRYGFNGVEKAPELGEGKNFTHFRIQDTQLGRWWSVDPRPNPGVSSYAMMEGSPIWHNDILGDTTRVYNLEGGLERTINDSFENEDHFLSKSALADLGCEGEECSSVGGNSSNHLGSMARGTSEFFVGAKTRARLSDIANTANTTDGKERGFLVYKPTGSKELEIVDVSEFADTDLNTVSYPKHIERAFIENSSKYIGSGGFLVGEGHVQTDAGIKNTFFSQYRPALLNAEYLNRPTDPNDYSYFLNELVKKPAFVASSVGYTLFSTNRQVNRGQVFDFNGNQIHTIRKGNFK